MMAASVVHIPLAPMTLEINAVSSEYVTWTYRWKNVDLSADFETYSQNFGHPDGWVWRMLFQQNVDAAGNRVYGIFLYVVMTDNELQERTWTRDIRYLQFVILNSEGRQLKDKTTVAMYRENQLSWGFPGLLDNSILLRDPVVNSRRTIDIVCRLRYHPNQEKLRRPLSPTIPAGLGSIIGNPHASARAASAPASYWDQKGAPSAMIDPVGKHLKKLLNNRDFSDLEIVVGPERHILYAHKAILAARSDWFRSALRPGVFREAREGRITVLEDDPKIFEALLEFLYTGEYPLSCLQNHTNPHVRSISSASKQPEAIHFSPRSPPTIPPRNMIDDTCSTTSFTAPDAPTPSNENYDYFDSDNSEDDYEDDEQRFQLFIMADKYGVTQLKTLIRLHLTSDLLDLSANRQPGQRLLKLIRFAFEDLPESTRTTPGPSGRDSGVGVSDRGCSPPGGFHNRNPYVFGTAAAVNVYSHNELENREGTASAFGHNSEDSDVGVAMTTEGRRSTSRHSTHVNNDGGIYGRDNETAILRESITVYVAKMFHAVRQVEGFDDILREGGEMGGFVKMVMEHMYRP